KGELVELNCTFIENSKSGEDTSGLKVKGTIHWVSQKHAKEVEVRAYDRLFKVENPSSEKDVDFINHINENSLEIFERVYIEPNFGSIEPHQQYQFLRLGYFSIDPDTRDGKVVFNKVVGLR